MINFSNSFNMYMTEKQYQDEIDLDEMKIHIIQLYFKSFDICDHNFEDSMYQYTCFKNIPKTFTDEINFIFKKIEDDYENEDIDISSLRKLILDKYNKDWECKSIIFAKYVRPVNVPKIQNKL